MNLIHHLPPSYQPLFLFLLSLFLILNLFLVQRLSFINHISTPTLPIPSASLQVCSILLFPQTVHFRSGVYLYPGPVSAAHLSRDPGWPLPPERSSQPATCFGLHWRRPCGSGGRGTSLAISGCTGTGREAVICGAREERISQGGWGKNGHWWGGRRAGSDGRSPSSRSLRTANLFCHLISVKYCS